MNTLTVTFRNADERDRVDLTRIGNVAGASDDGLTVRVEDVDVAEFHTDPTTAAIRAGMAACGVWVDVTPTEES